MLEALHFALVLRCGRRAWCVSLLRGNECVQDRLNPPIALHVPEDEIAIELPVGPTPARRLRRATHEVSVADPRVHRRLVISAELTQKDRTVVLLGPSRDFGQVVMDGFALGVSAPSDSAFVLLVRPRGALVRTPSACSNGP
jgi:hypothetical protein